MDTLYERVRRVYNHNYDERKRWEPLWYECARFVTPEFMDFTTGNKIWNPKDLIGDSVYDGSARIAAGMASSGMYGYACNPADEWVSVSVSMGDGMSKSPLVRDWETNVNILLMRTFEKYDLYRELIPVFNSIMSIGTASVSVEEPRTLDGIRYRFWHPGDYSLGVDGYNIVNQFGTEWEYEAHQLMTLYTRPELGEELFEKIQSNPFELYKIQYVVMPNALYAPGNPFAKKMPWAGYHLHPVDKRIMRQDGFMSFPVATWRWSTQGRLAYGFSPAAKAMPDVYVLNQSARTRLEAEQKAADPPMNIPKEMRDDYHLGPGGRSFYRSPERLIFPVSNRIDYPAAIDAVNRYSQLVNQHFFTDFFLSLVSSTTRRTTIEVTEIMQEKAAMLSPMITSMNSFLEIITRETLKILAKQGKLPEPPKEIMDKDLDVTFIGPLAVAQKNAQIQKRILSPINTSLSYAQFDNSVIDNFDFDKVTQVLGESSSIPFNILRSESDRDQRREQRNEAIMAQQQQENNLKREEMLLKYGGKQIEPNSPMARGEA